MKYTFCSIRVNVTVHDVTFATKEDSNSHILPTHSYATAFCKKKDKEFSTFLMSFKSRVSIVKLKLKHKLYAFIILAILR